MNAASGKVVAVITPGLGNPPTEVRMDTYTPTFTYGRSIHRHGQEFQYLSATLLSPSVGLEIRETPPTESAIELEVDKHFVKEGKTTLLQIAWWSGSALIV